MTELGDFLALLSLMGGLFLILFGLAEMVERAYERGERRNQPRPRIDDRERQLLGDDWRDRI